MCRMRDFRLMFVQGKDKLAYVTALIMSLVKFFDDIDLYHHGSYFDQDDPP